MLKQGPIVIETKTLLLTPPPQPIVDVRYQCPPPYTLSLSLAELRRTLPGPPCPYCPQSSVVAFDNLQLAPGSAPHWCPHGRTARGNRGSDKLHQSLHNICDQGPWQAADFSKMVGQVSIWVPLPRSRELPITIGHCFLPVALHCSGSVGPDALLESTSGSSSALRAVNLFHSGKPLGGAGALLLVPEVTSFHSSPSPEVALAILMDCACVHTAGGDLGLLKVLTPLSNI